MVDERKVTTWARAAATLLTFAVTTAVSGDARAAGAVLAPTEVLAAARAELREAIARARSSDPAIFAEVAALRSRLPELDAQKRGDVVPVALPLEDMGARALFPIVEELAFSTRGSGGVSPGAWRDWRAALVEALGLLHDVRTEPLVLALLAKRDAEPTLLRASVEAAGRLGTPAAVTRLLAIRPSDPEKRRAVLEGMGECRRLACVQALGAALAASTDQETTAVVARSLGRAASSWGWQTPELAATGEGPRVRAAASRALMNAVPTSVAGPARDAIFKALLVIEDPGTPQMAETARLTAPPDLARDLERLIVRLRSPKSLP